MSLQLESPAFEEGYPLPACYTCDGPGISPPLKWYAVPPLARSLVLMCDDRSNPIRARTHWTIYNIPVDRRHLPEGIPAKAHFADGCLQGVNDFGRIGFEPPCPKDGEERYFFHLFALDVLLPLAGSSTHSELLEAMNGHVIEDSLLCCRYKRGRFERRVMVA